MDSEKIWELKQEINKLLTERPEYIPFQKRIDEMLKGAGSQHNRMILIKEMMFEKVNELNEQLQILSSNLNGLGGKK